MIDETTDSHLYCDLGKWFYAEGRAKYAGVKEINDFEEVHIQLHEAIKAIVEQKKAGMMKSANEKYQHVLVLCHHLVRLMEDSNIPEFRFTSVMAKMELLQLPAFSPSDEAGAASSSDDRTGTSKS